MASLSWRASAPAHAALDSAQGTDLLLLDIRDGYDPASVSTWVAGFVDRCDTKAWAPDGCPWAGGGNQANVLYLDAYPSAREGRGVARPYERMAPRPPGVFGLRPCEAAPPRAWSRWHRPPRLPRRDGGSAAARKCAETS